MPLPLEFNTTQFIQTCVEHFLNTNTHATVTAASLKDELKTALSTILPSDEFLVTAVPERDSIQVSIYMKYESGEFRVMEFSIRSVSVDELAKEDAMKKLPVQKLAPTTSMLPVAKSKFIS